VMWKKRRSSMFSPVGPVSSYQLRVHRVSESYLHALKRGVEGFAKSRICNI
jgi:hypothetical protein